MRIIKLNNQIKKRFVFLLIIFVCFSTSIFLISYSLKDQIAYFVEPTDLKSMDGIESKYLRVGGLVKKNSLKLRNEKIAIKLDVERVELEALQGANQLLKNNRCFIIIETNKNKEGVFKYLKSLNFHQINHNFDNEDYFFTNFL